VIDRHDAQGFAFAVKGIVRHCASGACRQREQGQSGEDGSASESEPSFFAASSANPDWMNQMIPVHSIIRFCSIQLCRSLALKSTDFVRNANAAGDLIF
jgi:hypothetical protein